MTPCVLCEQRPAVACDECRRALAFLDSRSGFAAISRHPDERRDCRLCEAGDASLCVECLCQQVLKNRSAEGSPYAGPSPEEFEQQERRTAETVAQMAKVRQDTGADVHSPYEREPAPFGPSWYRDVAQAIDTVRWKG